MEKKSRRKRSPPLKLETIFVSDYGSFQPGPFITGLNDTLEENEPKRATKLSRAIRKYMHHYMQARAKACWELGGRVETLKTP